MHTTRIRSSSTSREAQGAATGRDRLKSFRGETYMSQRLGTATRFCHAWSITVLEESEKGVSPSPLHRICMYLGTSSLVQQRAGLGKRLVVRERRRRTVRWCASGEGPSITHIPDGFAMRSATVGLTSGHNIRSIWNLKMKLRHYQKTRSEQRELVRELGPAKLG